MSNLAEQIVNNEPLCDVSCPRCHRSLTAAQAKGIWSAFTRLKAVALGRTGGWPKGKPRKPSGELG